MPNTTTSPNMNLVLPVVLTDPGPDWATRLYVALNTLVDAHDHSAGKGIQITPFGLNINADLTFTPVATAFNAIGLRSSRYASQASALILGTDIGALYNVLGDAYWNNAAGTAIQLTKNGAVNATTLVFPLHPGTAGGTILATDPYMLYYLDVSGGPATINLPASAGLTPGRAYYFSDIKANSQTNNITIVPNGTNKINGINSNYVVSANGASAILTTDGAGNWTANILTSGALVAFGGDLAGSTASNQWVASINGPGGAGGTVPLNITTLSFARLQVNPLITQAIETTDVATNPLTLAAQSALASAVTNLNGGVLRLQGGAAKTNGTTGLRGPVRLQVGADTAETLIEACEPVVGQRVVALCQIGSGITSTQMPASSGDGVLYLAQATTVPTVAPATGLTVYSNAGSPGSLGLWSTGIAFNKGSGAPAIQQDTPTTAVAGNNFSLFAQNGGTGVQNGGDLVLGGGTRTSTGLDGIVRPKSLGLGIRAVSSAFTIDSSGADAVLECDTTGGVFNLTLPAASNGRYLRIVDKTNNFGTNAVTLVPPGAVQINGLNVNKVLSATGANYEAVSDGTNWSVRGI